jgi:hypothetical protein
VAAESSGSHVHAINAQKVVKNGYETKQGYEHLTGRPFPMEVDILVDR